MYKIIGEDKITNTHNISLEIYFLESIEEKLYSIQLHYKTVNWEMLLVY